MHSDGLVGIGKGAWAALAVGLVFCGLAVGIILWDVGLSRADSTPGYTKPNAPKAIAAGGTINEAISLEITQIKGDIISAEGRATGTFVAPASLYLKLVNASRAQAWIAVKNSGGSLNVYGTASYYAVGAASYFKGLSGNMHGTGKFAKLKNTGIKMTGSMDRKTLQISIAFRGPDNE